MLGPVISIERREPQPGEAPLREAQGYRLADSGKGPERRRPEHAIHVASLDLAAAMVENGYCLWMKGRGRAVLLALPDLCIHRAPPCNLRR